MTVPVGANLYTQGFGSRPEGVEIPFYSTGSPTSSNINFPLGKRWINTASNNIYTLTSFSSVGGVRTAVWSSAGAGAFIITGSGTATFGAGSTVTITDPTVLPSSKILLSGSSLSSTVGDWSSVPGTGSFVATSDQAGDTSTFFYAIIN